MDTNLFYRRGRRTRQMKKKRVATLIKSENLPVSHPILRLFCNHVQWCEYIQFIFREPEFSGVHRQRTRNCPAAFDVFVRKIVIVFKCKAIKYAETGIVTMRKQKYVPARKASLWTRNVRQLRMQRNIHQQNTKRETSNPCSLLKLRIYSSVNFNFNCTSAICSQIWVKICQIVNQPTFAFSKYKFGNIPHTPVLFPKRSMTVCLKDAAQISARQNLDLQKKWFLLLCQQYCPSQGSGGPPRASGKVRILKIKR